MSQTAKRWLTYVLITSTIVAIDQVIKWMVVSNLDLGETWDGLAIGEILRITRSHNTGAAFGMFPGASILFLVLAFVSVVVFAVMYPALPESAWLSRVSLALISGGALGNAISRLRYGYVVDYVHVRLTPTVSNISNIADHLITIGVILLLIDQWRLEVNHRAGKTADETTPPDGDLSESGASSEGDSTLTAVTSAESLGDDVDIPSSVR
jgi:signal peptidase II